MPLLIGNFPAGMHALSPDEVDVYTSLVERCPSAHVTVMHNHCMSEQVCFWSMFSMELLSKLHVGAAELLTLQRGRAWLRDSDSHSTRRPTTSSFPSTDACFSGIAWWSAMPHHIYRTAAGLQGTCSRPPRCCLDACFSVCDLGVRMR